MFTGLSAFPLTPMHDDRLDEAAFARLVARLAVAGVDSIGALGSTGSYPYLDRAERARAARVAVEHADGIPVMVGIGALRLRDVLHYAEDAQRAGASAVLLAPVGYHPLNAGEVFHLYEVVSRTLSVPLCVYDNPGTTRFAFTDELHAAIAALPNVASIKLPGATFDAPEAPSRISCLRARIPARVSLGVSGDRFAVAGFKAGCDLWYSVIGGLFPQRALAIARAAQAGDWARATAESDRLTPLWTLFNQHGGGVRVMATAAELMGLVPSPCLPAPLRPLEGEARRELATVLHALELG